jgi:phosphonate transport system substrate-binding protein
MLLPGVALADLKPLRIGILPTLSPRVILKNYEYLRRYLSQGLRQPIELGTATDFRAFHEQVMADEYDVVLTAAHLARLAQREKGWLPLATYTMPNRALLLVANKGPIHALADLRGKSLSSVDPLALVVIQGQQWLREKGLRANRDYQFIDASSFTSAAYAVLQQRAAMAIVSAAGYKQFPDPLKSQIHILQTLPEVPALIWMAHPKSPVDPVRLKALMTNFTAEQAEGRAFFKLTGYGGMRPVSDEQMQALDKYADEAQALLSAPQ